MRKARRDPADVWPGDPGDFRRVEAVGPGRGLLLRAEMRNPAAAADPDGPDGLRPANQAGGVAGEGVATSAAPARPRSATPTGDFI
jgi:hypothetical protein